LLRPDHAKSLLNFGRARDFHPEGSLSRAAFSLKKGVPMPGRKHLKGVGKKEQRQYEHILDSARKEGRYGERAKEVAARTVMKEHRKKGHRKGS
jgi:hypothetical protein